MAYKDLEKKRANSRRYYHRHKDEPEWKKTRQAAKDKWANHNKEYFRKYYRVHKYDNFSWEDFEKLVAEQDGKCLICGRQLWYALHIDHDHKTGRVRGLLCPTCNKGLGHFKDDPELLAKAVGYLSE